MNSVLAPEIPTLIFRTCPQQKERLSFFFFFSLSTSFKIISFLFLLPSELSPVPLKLSPKIFCVLICNSDSGLVLKRIIYEFQLISASSVYFKSNLVDTYLFQMTKGMCVKDGQSRSNYQGPCVFLKSCTWPKKLWNQMSSESLVKTKEKSGLGYGNWILLEASLEQRLALFSAS